MYPLAFTLQFEVKLLTRNLLRFDAGQYQTHVIFSKEDIGESSIRTGEALFTSSGHHLVKRTVFHPMYKHKRFHFDVAILELEDTVTGPKPIKLANPNGSYFFQILTVVVIFLTSHLSRFT